MSGEKMANYVSKLAATAVLLTATTGCAAIFGVSREDRDVNDPILRGLVTDRFQGKSDYTVVLIPEHHDSYACHASIYLTLEDMLDDIKFVAREGRVGPTEHTNEDFKKHRYFDHELNKQYYRDFLALPLKERQQKAHEWITEHKFPSIYTFARNWYAAMPMIAPVLLEAVYQDKVRTIGVEDQKALDKAKAITGPFSKADLEEEKNLKILLDDRNVHIVKNIQRNAQSIEGGKLVPFVGGYNHIFSRKLNLRAILKDDGISFTVIEHKPSCETETVN